MRDRLIYTLAVAGVPVDTVTLTGPASAVVTYLPFATLAQKTSGAQILAGFDWSKAAQDAWELQRRRDTGSTTLDRLGDEYTVMRALVTLLVDEINLLRQWVTSFKAATAAATTLPNLQTRVAATPNLVDRTLDQARTALINKILGGGADS